MSPIIENKLEDLYSATIQRVNTIVEIFNDFFGEERVDLQDIISKDIYIRVIKGSSVKSLTSPAISSMSEDELKTIKEYEHLDLCQIEDDSYAKILIKVLNNERCIQSLRHHIENYYSTPVILVHFPHVTISNEYGESTEIDHLYAKICVCYDGKMNSKFTLNRAEYSYAQYRSNYLHSHIPGIPNPPIIFQSPCLGNGPIKDTIESLTSYNIVDSTTTLEDMWKLFCLELSKYVETESIEGGPYHRISSITTNPSLFKIRIDYEKVLNHTPISVRFDIDYSDMVKEFTKYFISCKKLRFNFIDNSYFIAMSPFEYMLTISNCFIEWYNKQYNEGKYQYSLNILSSIDLLRQCSIDNNTFYSLSNTDDYPDYQHLNGRKVCTFKGEEVKLLIHSNEEGESITPCYILNPHFALSILTRVLYIINYEYSKPKHSGEENPESCKKIRIF